MSKITIIEPNASDKDNVKAYMVKGERGDDGVSPTFETSKEGHVATITITDVDGTHTVELEDGQDGRDLTGGVPTNSVIGWLGNEKIYTCDGTETGDYYFIYGNIYYYFTMPTVEDGDVLVFNTDDLELTLNETTITTSSTGAGTETELTFIDNLPNGYEFTDETFGGGGGESLPVGTEVDFDGNVQDIPTGWEVTSPRLVKLWENPSPTSSFASQNITLSSSDYDYLICIFKNAAGNQYQKSVMILKGAGGMLEMAWDYGIGGSYYIAEYYRSFARSTDTEYAVGNCNVRYNSGTTSTTDNNYVIPLYVYGGKF